MARKKKVKPTAIVRGEVSEAELETFRNLVPQTIVVSNEEFDWLLKMLDEPVKDNPKLRKLLNDE